MKREIDPTDYANQIVKALPPGILLNTCADGRFDTMVIGWGSIGVEWRRRTFTCYVRTSRLTHENLEKNPNFTVSVPAGAPDPEIIRVAGSKSGRDVDKAKELGLDLVDASANGVPGIRQFPITLECRVLYKCRQEPADIAEEPRKAFYADPSKPGEAPHDLYIGEIAAAYVIERGRTRRPHRGPAPDVPAMANDIVRRGDSVA